MSWMNIIFTAVIRAFFVFAPVIGIFTKDQDDFALRGNELDEAKELARTLNSRSLILSWSPLVVVALLSRASELNKQINPLSMILILMIAAVLCIIGVKIKSWYLRPAWVARVIFCAVTALDILFKLMLQDWVVHLISA
jgi:TRAP-type uncharacterized transport system fused permease subunit